MMNRINGQNRGVNGHFEGGRSQGGHRVFLCYLRVYKHIFPIPGWEGGDWSGVTSYFVIIILIMTLISGIATCNRNIGSSLCSLCRYLVLIS